MRTFPATISNHRGITLLEILVVIVLIATFITFAVPRFESTLDLHLKKQARMLSGTIQFLYSQAALKHQTYRLHYDLDNHQYWVETSTEKIELSSHEESTPYLKEKDQKKRPKFEKDITLLKKPVQLDTNIRFKDIKTEAQDLPISHGHAYTHFFPHGYAEQTRIRLESEKGNIYTILVNSLTGGAKVYDHDVEE